MTEPLKNDFTDETPMATVHAESHNAVANLLNAQVHQLTAQAEAGQTQVILDLQDSNGDSGLSVLVGDKSLLFLTTATGQLESILEVYNSDDNYNTVFAIGPDGYPIINSPDGTRYRIKVANDGTLSTEAV